VIFAVESITAVESDGDAELFDEALSHPREKTKKSETRASESFIENPE